MPSTLTPDREDHLRRNRHAEPGHDHSGDRAARLAKPEAPRAAGRTRRPRGRRGFHRIRRGRRWPVMARRGACAARRGRWPMRLSRGPGPTGCRPGGGGSPSSTALRCPRRSVVMAVRTAAACPDLPGELACPTRALTAPRGRWPMRLSRGPGPTGCRPGGGGSPSSTALRCPRRSVVMAVRTATACPDLPGELPDPGADSATLRGAEPRAGRARPRRILDARGVLHRLHDIVAGIWHVEGWCRYATGSPIRRSGVGRTTRGRFSPERAVVRAPVSPGCGPWENLVYPDGRLRSRRTRYSFVWLALRLSSGSRPPIFARIWSRVSQE